MSKSLRKIRERKWSADMATARNYLKENGTKN
jgi:hypothetical protein